MAKLATVAWTKTISLDFLFVLGYPGIFEKLTRALVALLAQIELRIFLN
jgi:hypothetical protein